MIVALQHPLILWNMRRSAESQIVGSSLKTRVICARAPSYRAA
jgi:hypothetical protein